MSIPSEQLLRLLRIQPFISRDKESISAFCANKGLLRFSETGIRLPIITDYNISVCDECGIISCGPCALHLQKELDIDDMPLFSPSLKRTIISDIVDNRQILIDDYNTAISDYWLNLIDRIIEYITPLIPMIKNKHVTYMTASLILQTIFGNPFDGQWLNEIEDHRYPQDKVCILVYNIENIYTELIFALLNSQPL